MSPRVLGLAGRIGTFSTSHAATAQNTQNVQESLSDHPVPQTPQASGLPLSADLSQPVFVTKVWGDEVFEKTELLSPYRSLHAGSIA